jgi:hypothetical protein
MPQEDAIREGLERDVKRLGDFTYATAFLGIILKRAMIPNCCVDCMLRSKDDRHMVKRRLVEQEKFELQKTKRPVLGRVFATTVIDVTLRNDGERRYVTR